jgi:predicted alpha/beta hydrolase family esterase
MNAVIFHGTGGHPANVWYGWLGERLAARGYQVDLPHYPDLNKEPIATFLPEVLAAHEYGPQTVLVGHSGGAALLLSLLEHLDTQVAQAILVAGYCTPPTSSDEPVLQGSYDWDLVKSHVGELVFVNSWADPYGCDAEQGRAMLNHLGGTQIVRNDGHFGDWNQDYPTFELLDRLIVDFRTPRST